MTTPRYTATEAARLTDASVESVRTWAKRGLIGRLGDTTFDGDDIVEIATRHHLAQVGIEGHRATPFAHAADQPFDVVYYGLFANGDAIVDFARPEGAVVTIEVDLAQIRSAIAARMSEESPDES